MTARELEIRSWLEDIQAQMTGIERRRLEISHELDGLRVKNEAVMKELKALLRYVERQDDRVEYY